MGPAAGRRAASWGLLGGLAVLAAAQPLGCATEPAPEDDPRVAEVLAAVGPEVVLPALAAVHEDAVAAEQAMIAWEAAIGTEDEAAEKALAVEAFRAVVRSWQVVEVMQIGPLASSATAVAGGDGRDRIYSWPLTNPCRVDQETGRQAYAADGWADAALVNVLGLDALEHLLFAGPDNVCPGQVDINEDGLWDALGEEGVRQARAEYAVVLTGALVADLEAQQAAWEAFGPKLAAAGDGSPYETQIDGLNAVFDALFYLETRSKDLKLAVPLGLRDCAEPVCPEEVEHVPSGESLVALEANLDGFEQLFTGGDGPGLDDLLRERGHTDLADQVLADLDNARSELEALGVPVDAGVVDDPDQALAAHDAIKQIADDLKGDIATVLSMQIPAEAAGDAD